MQFNGIVSPFATGYGDLTFNLTAYVCGISSNILQALHLILVQRLSDGYSSVEALHLTSINSAVIMAIISIFVGEPRRIVVSPALYTEGFPILFASLITLGCLSNYSLILCTSVNSALTSTVVSTLRTIVETWIGFFAFGGVTVTPLLLSGVITNLGGAGLYAFARYKEQTTKLHST